MHLLRREVEEPPTELRYRQWVAYFIFSCFLGNDKSTIPTPIVSMFRDIDANGKEIGITHTLAKWGSVSRKIKVKT